MISSKIKNNIYALASLSVITMTVISFVLITGFLVNMNNQIFSSNESAKNESGVSLDISGYNSIKDLFQNNDK